MIWDFTKYGDSIALKQDDESVTYNELANLSDDIAGHIGERSLVFVMSSNEIGSLAGYVGFVNHGIVPLMLDADINDSLLNDLLADYRPSYIWAPEKKAETFASYKEIYSVRGYTLYDTGEEKPFPMNEELGVLISTSGSTGSPKLVRQTYRNIIANTESIVEYLGIDENEIAITTLPMNYVYGLSVLHTHLYAGAKIVMTNAMVYSKKFWDKFKEEEVTSFAGVPFIYEMLFKLKIVKKNPLESLRYMTQAGGKISPELQKYFSDFARETGRKFIVMYGASEATARMAYLPFEYSEQKNGSIGIAIPGGRFELVDEKGGIIEESNKTGELIYYGDNVTLGYAVHGEDLIKEDENKGRLQTGDMAYRDEDGFYFIVGRKKRFLKILGKRTNLDETERILKKQFDTIDIACGGQDDELRIFVTDEALKEPAIRAATDIIGISRGLVKCIVIDEIPKNNSGKILYSKLNEIEV